MQGIKSKESLKLNNITLKTICFISFISVGLFSLLYFFDNPNLICFKLFFGFYSAFVSLGILWGYICFQNKLNLDIFDLTAIALPLNCLIISFFYIIFRIVNASSDLFIAILIFLHIATFLLIFFLKKDDLTSSAIYNKYAIYYVFGLLLILSIFYSFFIPSFTPIDEHFIYNSKIALNISQNPFNIRYSEVLPQNKLFITYPIAPLLYYYWSYSMQILGSKIETFRMLNIFFYIISSLYIYRFAKFLGGIKRGIYAVLLFVFSFYPIHLLERMHENIIVSSLYLISIYYLFLFISKKQIYMLRIALLYTALSGLFQEIGVSFLPLAFITVTLLFKKELFKPKVLKAYIYYIFPVLCLLGIGFVFSGTDFLVHVFNRQIGYTFISNINTAVVIEWIPGFIRNFIYYFSLPLMLLIGISIFDFGKDRKEQLLYLWAILLLVIGGYATLREFNRFMNVVTFFPIALIIASNYPKSNVIRFITIFVFIWYISINFYKIQGLAYNYQRLNEIRKLDFQTLSNLGVIDKSNDHFALGKEGGVVSNFKKRYYEQDTIISSVSRQECMDFGRKVTYIEDFDSYFLFLNGKQELKPIPDLKFNSLLIPKDNCIYWEFDIENVSGAVILAITPIIEVRLCTGRYLIKKLFYSFSEDFYPPGYCFLFEKNEPAYFTNGSYNTNFYTGKRYGYYRSLKDEIESVDYKYLVLFDDPDLAGYAIYPINN